MRHRDALSALVAEVAALDAEIGTARAAEEDARASFVEARQVLDARAEVRKLAEARLELTHSALAIVSKRDEVARETVKALIEAARGPEAVA